MSDQFTEVPATIAIPAPPAAQAPHAFPLVASIAPVLGSVLIWLITQSPFALVFAFLGPVVAVASTADSKIQGRRHARTERARFRRELQSTRALIDERHTVERARLRRANPGATGILESSPRDPERWRGEPSHGIPVSLGLGQVTSALRLDTAGSASHLAVARADGGQVEEQLATLRLHAATLADAPVVVDARLGIGVCGPVALSAAMVRGILLQIAHRLRPTDATFSASEEPEWKWLASLPHARASTRDGPPPAGSIRWRTNGESALVALAPSAEQLPGECRVVVRLGEGRSAHLVSSPGAETIVPLVPEFVSTEQALVTAQLLATAAETRGVVSRANALPVSGEFADLIGAPVTREIGPLECAFAWCATGPFPIDLARDGPHAVVGGTTGSGKSELLVSWVLAMAAVHPPSDVNFLLVDFKGGSSFAMVQGLPHVVGVLTDLDQRGAHRALLSLRAELRYRERALADSGARAIEDPRVTLPRLVIVVDEFAAMVADFPELHDLFADLASRGRSLGVHLILCTQRPAGVVRDAVLANATLRMSLRVNNRSDSVAVLGGIDAAGLPKDIPGRVLVSVAGSPPQLLQVARASESDIPRVSAFWPGDHHPRRPWCDDLPTRLPLRSLGFDGHGIPIGLADLPQLQRQETAVYDPPLHGNLLVLGGQRSGKSELLSTMLEAPGARRLPSSIEEAWDAVTAMVHRVRRAIVSPGVLLIDDLDALLARYSEEYQFAFVDLILELLRDGGSVGLHLVITARQLPAALHTVAGLCDARLILRMPTRQDHLAAGGSSDTWVADAPPGAGQWQGSRLQIAIREPDAAKTAASGIESFLSQGVPWTDLAGRRTLAVVSTRPAEFVRRLGESGIRLGEVIELTAEHPGRAVDLTVTEVGSPTLIVADPETWQSRWSAMTSVRSRVGVLFDRCSPAEFRAVSGRRTLPPPISSYSGGAWLLEPGGTLSRVPALPLPAISAEPDDGALPR